MGESLITGCTMTFKLEYHKTVQRWIPATVALFGLFAFSILLVSSSHAQISSASASAGSSGSGGHSASGGSASVSSFGHSGFTPSHAGSTLTTHVPTHSNTGQNTQRHNQDSNSGRGFTYPYLYLYAVPYGVPYAADDGTADANAEDDSNYQGGPTIFDRRGSGADSYIPPAQDATSAYSSPAAEPPEPESPPDPTALVFKDGHQIDVGNYAIVGQTLYDLTPGHPRKIALADLDLPATEKQNDDRGVSFQLPPSAQAN